MEILNIFFIFVILISSKGECDDSPITQFSNKSSQEVHILENTNLTEFKNMVVDKLASKIKSKIFDNEAEEVKKSNTRNTRGIQQYNVKARVNFAKILINHKTHADEQNGKVNYKKNAKHLENSNVGSYSVSDENSASEQDNIYNSYELSYEQTDGTKYGSESSSQEEFSSIKEESSEEENSESASNENYSSEEQYTNDSNSHIAQQVSKPAFQKCPLNEIFYSCGTSCPKTCANFDNYDKINKCSSICVQGCFCRKGYVRNSIGICIQPNECSLDVDKSKDSKESTDSIDDSTVDNSASFEQRSSEEELFIAPQIGRRCFVDEVYLDCGTACPRTCQNYTHVFIQACSTKCVKGCFCRNNLVRNSKGRCVSSRNCKKYETNSNNTPSKSSELSSEESHEVTTNQPKCPKNEVFLKCGNTCLATCDQILNSQVIKCAYTCVNGCFCKEGYVRDRNGKCVSLSSCHATINTTIAPVDGITEIPNISLIQCPGNEEFSTCGSLCQTTCDTITNSQIISCPAVCASGCFCRQGFVRNSKGNCILTKNCENDVLTYTRPTANTPWTYPTKPRPRCASNEEFLECGNACNENCNATKFIQINPCKEVCVSKCFCRKGFLRNKYNRCIPYKQCKDLEPHSSEESFNSSLSPDIDDHHILNISIMWPVIKPSQSQKPYLVSTNENKESLESVPKPTKKPKPINSEDTDNSSGYDSSDDNSEQSNPKPSSKPRPTKPKPTNHQLYGSTHNNHHSRPKPSGTSTNFHSDSNEYHSRPRPNGETQSHHTRPKPTSSYTGFYETHQSHESYAHSHSAAHIHHSHHKPYGQNTRPKPTEGSYESIESNEQSSSHNHGGTNNQGGSHGQHTRPNPTDGSHSHGGSHSHHNRPKPTEGSYESNEQSTSHSHGETNNQGGSHGHHNRPKPTDGSHSHGGSHSHNTRPKPTEGSYESVESNESASHGHGGTNNQGGSHGHHNRPKPTEGSYESNEQSASHSHGGTNNQGESHGHNTRPKPTDGSHSHGGSHSHHNRPKPTEGSYESIESNEQSTSHNHGGIYNQGGSHGHLNRPKPTDGSHSHGGSHSHNTRPKPTDGSHSHGGSHSHNTRPKPTEGSYESVESNESASHGHGGTNNQGGSHGHHNRPKPTDGSHESNEQSASHSHGGTNNQGGSHGHHNRPKPTDGSHSHGGSHSHNTRPKPTEGSYESVESNEQSTSHGHVGTNNQGGSHGHHTRPKPTDGSHSHGGSHSHNTRPKPTEGSYESVESNESASHGHGGTNNQGGSHGHHNGPKPTDGSHESNEQSTSHSHGGTNNQGGSHGHHNRPKPTDESHSHGGSHSHNTRPKPTEGSYESVESNESASHGHGGTNNQGGSHGHHTRPKPTDGSHSHGGSHSHNTRPKPTEGSHESVESNESASHGHGGTNNQGGSHGHHTRPKPTDGSHSHGGSHSHNTRPKPTEGSYESVESNESASHGHGGTNNQGGSHGHHNRPKPTDGSHESNEPSASHSHGGTNNQGGSHGQHNHPKPTEGSNSHQSENGAEQSNIGSHQGSHESNEDLESQISTSQQCGLHEEFLNCGSYCAAKTTCTHPPKRSCFKKSKCVQGCFCKRGYLRQKGTCIPINHCPPMKCRKHEIFMHCGSLCPENCDTIFSREQYKCEKKCARGCFCETGYVRNRKGKCVLRHKCSKH